MIRILLGSRKEAYSNRKEHLQRKQERTFRIVVLHSQTSSRRNGCRIGQSGIKSANDGLREGEGQGDITYIIRITQTKYRFYIKINKKYFKMLMFSFKIQLRSFKTTYRLRKKMSKIFQKVLLPTKNRNIYILYLIFHSFILNALLKNI